MIWKRFIAGGVGRQGVAWAVVLAACAGGCGESNGPETRPDTAAHLTAPAPARPAALRAYRHSVLLDFERPTDAVFVTPAANDALPSGGLTCADGALRAEGGGGIDVKLSSLLSGRPFPGDWTLLGGHLRSDRDVQIELACSIDGQVVLQKRQDLPAGQSTPALLDLRALGELSLRPDQEAILSIRPLSADIGTIEVEDLLLVDNRRTLSPAGADWTIEQIGYSLIIHRPQRFRITLPIDQTQAPAWAIGEISGTRLVADQNDPPLRWVIYADGRSYESGKLRIVGPKSEYDALYERQHAAPAQVTIPEDQGELRRQTPGDANNDGYNELMGAYQIAAHGGRLDITLAPTTPALVMPVLEITGLPAGKLVVTIEGRLIETVERLADGRVLLTLPHKILRPATVNVRVQ